GLKAKSAHERGHGFRIAEIDHRCRVKGKSRLAVGYRVRASLWLIRRGPAVQFRLSKLPGTASNEINALVARDSYKQMPQVVAIIQLLEITFFRAAEETSHRAQHDILFIG